MSENEHRPQYPLSFTIIETTSKRSDQINTYIGNTGGKYEHIRGTDFFTQHFAPDSSWDPARNLIDQRKHATLYPAALWEFLQWQSSLPDDDPRKLIDLIKGSTNEVMSNFRKKLLGDSYTHQREENEHNPTAPQFVYEISISSIKKNIELMQKLERFTEKAKSANYSMTNKLPEPGEVPSFIITLDDLKQVQTSSNH